MANPYDTLSPEDFAQQQQINRQQKMAEMLMSQNQQPQGQMVSGRYVAPSFFQNILPLVNTYVGKGMLEQGDTKQRELAELIRGRNATEAQDIIQTLQGTPAKQVPQAGPPTEAMLGQDQFNMPNRTIAGVAPDRQAALMKALKSSSPMGQMVANTLITKSLEDPKEYNLGADETRYRTNPDGTTTQIAKGQGKAHVVGNSLIVDGKAIYTGEEKPVQVDTGTAIQYREARTGKILWSTPKQHVFAPHAPIIKETDDGLVSINPYTLKSTPLMGSNNQPLMGTKALTETQGNATAFGMRMIDSNRIINNLAKDGVNTPSFLTGLEKVPLIGGTLRSGVNILPGVVGGQNEKEQSLLAAKRNFITAVLRKESGAAIGENEFVTEDLKYFPQRGDSQLVIDQKADARKLAIDAMKIQAGPGARQIVERKQPNTGEIPKGVTKEQWDVMTSEEKAAFK
jgi:hypothetical protein